MWVKNFWLPFLWAVIILVLSGLSGNSISKIPFINLPYFDKVLHLSFYLIFSILLCRGYSLQLQDKTGKWPYIFTFLTAFLYGLLIELFQATIFSGRTADWRDAAANATGIALGLLLYKPVKSLISRYIKSF
jgi:VanZ family protein